VAKRDVVGHFVTPSKRFNSSERARTAVSAALLIVVATTSTSLAAGAAPDTQKPSRDQVVETTFESVDAVIAGQWDFPARTPAPLVVIIPSQGRLDRDGRPAGLGEEPDQGMYAKLAKVLVAAGFAVFRFDKPGAGRSAPGRYSTERSNAIEAYTRAVDHARVDTSHVFLLGHSAGTDTIAGIYTRYESVNPPRGVVFLDNVVGERLSMEVKAPLLIVNPNKDPDDRFTFGEFVVETRRTASEGKLLTDLRLIDGAEPGLIEPSPSDTETLNLHPSAISAVVDWLRKSHAAGLDGARLPRSRDSRVELLHFSATAER
jgi:pimeloyl-ACP methyl ester carboxylesterase